MEDPHSSNGERADRESPKIRYQMEVYFDRYPTLDLEELEEFINECDADAPDTCEIRGVGEEHENEEGLRIGSFAAFMGSMTIATLVHNVPSPAREILEHAALADPVKKELQGHRSFALLTLLGGDDLQAVERMLFLYKLCTALCWQGGAGIGNADTGRVFPGGLLRELFVRADPDADESVWTALRLRGEPIQLLTHFGWIDLLGRRYLATCGNGYSGLPDMIWEYTEGQDPEEIAQVFRSCFNYMIANGPVIQPGHTMGSDENVAFRFVQAPEGLELPYPSESVLQVIKAR